MVGLKNQIRVSKTGDSPVINNKLPWPVELQVPGKQGSVAMASVPQGMHAARKVRQNMSLLEKNEHRDKGWNSGVNPRNWQQYPSSEKQLTQYSEKMMNSIWGLYNRYSVHNFKSNTSGGQTKFYQQSA